MLKFDPEKHIYTFEEAEIPSVTQVLPYNFYGNDNEQARVKGNYVHEMIRLYNLNDLDEDTLDPALKPYLDAYLKFRAEHPLKGVYDLKSGSPTPVTDLQLAAYTLLVTEGVNAEGQKITKGYETPLYHPVYQFAGTPDLVKYEGVAFPNLPAYAVYLQDNGKYNLSELKNHRQNIQIFLSFLTCHKWQKQKGLK